MKKNVKWEAVVPEKEGTYYVYGPGITGRVQRVFKDGKWDLQKDEEVDLVGELDSPTIRSVKTSIEKTSLSEAVKKSLRINTKQTITMLGELKDADEIVSVPIVKALVLTDGQVIFDWCEPEKYADDTAVLEEFNSFADAVSKTPAKKASSKKKETEVAKTEKVEETKTVEETEEDVTQEDAPVPFDDVENNDESTVHQATEVDDLPF